MLYSLDDPAVNRLKKSVETDLDLVIWVGDWLTHLNIFSDAVIYDILKFIKPELEKFDFDLKNGNDKRVLTLGICDYRWVSLSTIPIFLDTKTSEYADSLSEFAVTHIMCDIAALRKRMLFRQGMFHGKHTSNSNECPAAPDKAIQQHTQ